MTPRGARRDGAAATGRAYGIPALQVDGLTVSYAGRHAVHDVSLRAERGQVVALIGETGSGKSSLALGVARLLPSGAAASGQVRIAGQDVSAMGGREFRRARAGLLGYIAQDAMAALNPVLPAGHQVAELFRVHQGLSRRAAAERAVAELARMRISQPAAAARRYPHELSGGMRQRVMIAMAVALSPPLLIADESTTALDVSTQAEILALLSRLRAGSDVGILCITHDMGVVAELADSVCVMYAGRIVERGPVLDVFDHPAHPYTEGLLRTRRDLRSGRPGELLYQIAGSPPAAGAGGRGCPFAPRCPRATEVCAEVAPALSPVGAAAELAAEPAQDRERAAACHHPALPAGSPA